MRPGLAVSGGWPLKFGFCCAWSGKKEKKPYTTRKRGLPHHRAEKSPHRRCQALTKGARGALCPARWSAGCSSRRTAPRCCGTSRSCSAATQPCASAPLSSAPTQPYASRDFLWCNVEWSVGRCSGYAAHAVPGQQCSFVNTLDTSAVSEGGLLSRTKPAQGSKLN